jgi:hypothetical protein
VRDPGGTNLALVSRGAGVTVSSTAFLMDHDRLTQALLSGPIQHDLGLTWVRIGADNGLLTWNAVEREKGRLQLDPVADDLVTEMRRNGIRIIMNLDAKANWNYRGPSHPTIADPEHYPQGYGIGRDFASRGRKPAWREARIRELNNIYYDFPGWAWETEDMFEGYLRYVDFMVRHFKGTVAYYEVGNEWGGRRDVFARAVRRIKQADPEARIMVCVGEMKELPALLRQLMAECPPEEAGLLMPDAVGSHPTTRGVAGMTLDDLEHSYWEETRRAIQAARSLGYRGVFIASEVYSWSLYPPGPLEVDGPVFCGESEIVRATYLAQCFVGHCALGMMAFQCNSYFVSCPVGQSLLRLTSPAQVLNPVQPETGYYVLRTLCTVMDGWRAADVPASCRASGLRSFGFMRGDNELMVAAWIPGNTDDEGAQTRTDITLAGVRARCTWAIDLLNGTEQALDCARNGEDTVLKSMLVRNVPLLVRFEKA